jgi:CHAT domain-containing protein
LRDLQERRGQLADKVRAISPRLASLQYAPALDLAGVRQVLDPGTLLLVYNIGPEASRLFVVRPPGAAEPSPLDVHTLPIGDLALREQVSALARLIERQGNDPRAADSGPYLAIARRLYDLLMAPAERSIEAADRVLVVADGALHSLPFAALVKNRPAADGRSWQYVVEWKPLHTVLSATVYAELKKARSTVVDEGSIVAFGDPRYDGIGDRDPASDVPEMLRRGATLTPLPATRVEVEAVARIFGERATTYLGADATEERAKSTRQARVLHFATHGLLDPRTPLDSALVLSLPTKRREGEDNGLLQAWEIFEQVRLDADLVTLSACRTALGTELAGEGLIGLTRAFHYAGARSVLSSLWRVDDQSTSSLMVSFYRHLKTGVPKDEALRRAQREAVGRADTAAPFHWAAFTLSGDWR